nr:hypothetical protein Itr_chr04CG19620 [Ipomoea trifida]GMC82603.1 hypothetical protein Iba_chr04bCG14950 [Ipomoea batatas]GME11407.1 hypothetical protein Iba_scaffold11612CG0010 [Ipomoea batatas]
MLTNTDDVNLKFDEIMDSLVYNFNFNSKTTLQHQKYGNKCEKDRVVCEWVGPPFLALSFGGCSFQHLLFHQPLASGWSQILINSLISFPILNSKFQLYFIIYLFSTNITMTTN